MDDPDSMLDFYGGREIALSTLTTWLIAKMVSSGVLELDDAVTSIRELAATQLPTGKEMLLGIAEAIEQGKPPPRPEFGVIKGGRDDGQD